MKHDLWGVRLPRKHNSLQPLRTPSSKMAAALKRSKEQPSTCMYCSYPQSTPDYCKLCTVARLCCTTPWKTKSFYLFIYLLIYSFSVKNQTQGRKKLVVLPITATFPTRTTKLSPGGVVHGQWSMDRVQRGLTRSMDPDTCFVYVH